MQKESQGTTFGTDRRYEPYMSEDTEAQPEGVMASTMSKVQDGMSKVSDSVEGGKDSMAGGIETAAEKVREKLPTDGMVGQVSTKAADTLDRTAGYLRDHETGELWGDVEAYVRQHPATALAGALAAGFVLSRILR